MKRILYLLFISAIFLNASEGVKFSDVLSEASEGKSKDKAIAYMEAKNVLTNADKNGLESYIKWQEDGYYKYLKDIQFAITFYAGARYIEKLDSWKEKGLSEKEITKYQNLADTPLSNEEIEHLGDMFWEYQNRLSNIILALRDNGIEPIKYLQSIEPTKSYDFEAAMFGGAYVLQMLDNKLDFKAMQNLKEVYISSITKAIAYNDDDSIFSKIALGDSIASLSYIMDIYDFKELKKDFKSLSPCFYKNLDKDLLEHCISLIPKLDYKPKSQPFIDSCNVVVDKKLIILDDKSEFCKAYNKRVESKQ